MNHFKGKQFKKDVIIVAVGYYLRYNLSYREVQELSWNKCLSYYDLSLGARVQQSPLLSLEEEK